MTWLGFMSLGFIGDRCDPQLRARMMAITANDKIDCDFGSSTQPSETWLHGCDCANFMPVLDATRGKVDERVASMPQAA